MTPLRLAFMGTPAFAVPSLDALLASPHEVAAVYTLPERAGRRGGRRVRKGGGGEDFGQFELSPVAARAAEAGVPVRAPRSLGDGETQAAFAALSLDLAVVVAYGLILPAPVLAAPRLGCINAHASLLPRWRGAAPIERAIMAGDKETGVTIMRMDQGLDTGPILLRVTEPIGPATTGGALRAALAERSARLLCEAVDGLAAGRLVETPQPAEGARYAAKLEKSDAEIDWRRPAACIARTVRALAPSPGAWFTHEGERIKLLAAEETQGGGGVPCGTVVEPDPTVACGDATALRLTRLQRGGRAAMAADAFLRGRPMPPGTCLPCPATS